MVVTREKNDKPRVCMEYHLFSKKIIKELYLLPLIEDQIYKLEGAQLYHVLDLIKRFLHVSVEEDI